MNSKTVIEWIKANVLTIVFLVLTVASLVAMPLVARSMNVSLREEVESRARTFSQLEQLEQTSVRIPSGDGTSRTENVLVNQQLLREYERYIEQEEEDARQVYEQAVQFNRQGRDVLMPELFPEPPAARRDVLQPRFHERLMEAYDELLASVNAGSPPSAEALHDDLQRREFQVRSQVFHRSADEQLPADERRELEQQLATLRLIRYQEAAEGLTFYASRDALTIPEWDQTRMPYPMEELFEWQWRYWLHSDVLRALYRANDGQTLLRGPVKRVIRIALTDPPSVQQAGEEGDRGGRGAAGGGGRSAPGGAPSPRGPSAGGGGGAGIPGRNDAQQTQKRPIDPTAEVSRSFAQSLTGRTTNPLYDVRYVQLDLILDSHHIPEVIDALAAENFMSVLDVSVQSADPYQAARDGFFYGDAPIARVSMTVETIWMRDWTSQFMPEATRDQLGVAIDE